MVWMMIISSSYVMDYQEKRDLKVLVIVKTMMVMKVVVEVGIMEMVVVVTEMPHGGIN